MSGAGGKLIASSVTEGHIEKLGGVGYLSSDIVHRLPDEGQLIPTPGPVRGLYFFPTSSADLASHFTPSSGGSCTTTA